MREEISPKVHSTIHGVRPTYRKVASNTTTGLGAGVAYALPSTSWTDIDSGWNRVGRDGEKRA